MLLRPTMNMVKAHLVVCIFIACKSYDVFAQEPCFNNNYSQNGKCTPLPDCMSARENLAKKGHFPQTCRFNGTIRFVCCVENTDTKIEVRKFKQMCDEYEEDIIKLLGGKCINYIPEKIIIGGGVKAHPKEFPHMVAIGYEDQNNMKTVYICGGSLISRNFVLTAAHCLHSRNYGSPKTIRIGDVNLNSDDDYAKPQEINISKMHRHPDFKPPAKYNDIALLELEKDVDFTPYAYPACLSAKEEVKNFTLVIATGWGNTNAWGDKSDLLLRVNIRVFPHDNCSHFFVSKNRTLSNGISKVSHICAGSTFDRKDTCEGDSGGPLQIPRSFCMFDVLGLTSFGKPCLLTTAPGVYTKIYPFISWIESIVWP